MPHFDRVDVFEEIDVNKTSRSKQYNIYHCLCFLNKGINFYSHVCNKFHDFSMIPMNLSDTSTLKIPIVVV